MPCAVYAAVFQFTLVLYTQIKYKNKYKTDIYPSSLHNSFYKQLRLNEFQISGLFYANKFDIKMYLAIV